MHGIVAEFITGHISNCSVSGTINSINAPAGGIVARQYASQVDYCTNYANIIVENGRNI